MTRYVTGFHLSAVMASVLFLSVAAHAQGAPGAPTPGTPLAPVSPPPPAPATAAAPLVPPADAVALCRDGTFIVAPATVAGCESRGGIHVVMPRRVPPAAPVATPASESRADDAARERAAATPPPGATMRCKDGTWLTGAQDATRCENAGGVALLITQPLAPPPLRP